LPPVLPDWKLRAPKNIDPFILDHLTVARNPDENKYGTHAVPPDGLPPRYAIRLEDLRRWHRIVVRCGCGHAGVIPAARLKFGRPGYARLKDLERRFVCRSCGARGDHSVTIESADRV